MSRASTRSTIKSATISAISFVASVVFLFPAAANSDSGPRHIEVVEPGKTLFGKSYQELTGEWANWLQKEPPESSPASDSDGDFCDLNQEGKIWFLAGTFGGVANRECTIPAGRGVFFPIFAFISFAEVLTNAECLVLSEEVDQVRCDAAGPTAPSVALDVTIDGMPVDDLYAYRVQSEPGGFRFELGPLFENLGLAPGERFPAVMDGYWILLEPLPPGHHTVTFSAICDETCDVDLGANYDLFVPGPPPQGNRP